MNLDPIRNAAADLTSLFAAGIWPDPSADGASSLMMPALAGVAAGITLALMLAIYFQTGYRSYRDMIRHGLAAALGFSLLAFVIYDMRNAALAHIIRASNGPAAEFQLRWRETTERDRTITDEMDRHTGRSAPEAHQG